jgi:methionyl-tRNA formyltransferase
MITEVISDIITGKYSAVPQDENSATYCSKVIKEDGIIDWNETSVEIERKFRAYTPWPGIYTFWKGKNLLITKCHIPPEIKQVNNLPDITPGTVAGVDRKEGILIKTGDSLLAVTGIKLQSKNEMDFKAFLNGAGDFPGSVLKGEINDELA